jgi:hypothetical protein
MDEPLNDPRRIRLVEPALQWARAHPSFFFQDGVVSAESLVEQVVAGAEALGATAVEVHAIGGGLVVAAGTDWFASARFPIPEDFNFQALTPFPELGENCVRPECVVAAFAEQVIVRGPLGTHVVKGIVAPADPLFIQVAGAAAWRRAIVFRGLVGA